MNDYVTMYTDAVYSLAAEEQLAEQFLEDINAVCGILEKTPEYITLLDAPTVETENRVSLLDQTFGGQVHKYVLNFMKVLAEKRRMHLFSACRDAFSARYDADHGIVRVQAVTAAALSDELLDAMRAKIGSAFQKKVVLTNTVDASCIGGVILRYENKQIDGSVRTRLETIRKQLTASVI